MSLIMTRVSQLETDNPNIPTTEFSDLTPQEHLPSGLVQMIVTVG